MCGRLELKSVGAISQPSDVEAVLVEDSWVRILSAGDGTGSNAVGALLTLIQHVRRSRILFCGVEQPDRPHADAIKKLLSDSSRRSHGGGKT